MEEQAKQIAYRDARISNQYDGIWQSTGKCVFCHLRDKYILREENGMVLTISLFAYIDGHLMIIPRRHVRAAKDLTQAEWDTVRKFSYLAKKMIKDVHGVKGMQLLLRDGGIVAQSTVSDHLHIHCIPFDAPDLSVWNYRKLKHTPLENVALYRSEAKIMTDLSQRFEHKYRHPSGLPIICTLIIINQHNEVLLQERPEWAKLIPDVLSIPGGGVQDYTVPLEQELAREVKEEIGYDVNTSAVKLVHSHICVINGNDYPHPKRVLWNHYVMTGFDKTTPLTPGDDAKHLLWIPLKDVAHHPQISPEAKTGIAKVIT
jgi:diadenosine tetraphosphate (Ap4A) HIT family hydrolase/ADP-ribose pyrophosphatase YjhB (NUDIX family)